MAVVADAGPDAGLGHVSRSGAVAVALAELGVGVSALGLGLRAPFERDGVRWEPLDSLSAVVARAVVLDSYLVAPADLAALAARARLVLMHDRGAVPAGVALLVSVASDGPAWACLRPMFWDVPQRQHRPSVERVLVTTGGGDPGGAGARLAMRAADALPDASVALVRGPQADASVPSGVEAVVAPDSLLPELLRADVVVSAAGQTMLEACAAGTPCVAVPLANNQRAQGERLGELGAVVYADEAGVPEALRSLADAEPRQALATRAREVVDGRGALRLAERIAGLI